jgi:hypothetical protein
MAQQAASTTRKALGTYLNDHLAGATMGRDLARQLASQTEGTPLGERMSSIAAAVEADREALEGLMERLGIAVNPLKQGVTWITEKIARLKFSGTTTGDRRLGTFLALETLSLGVEGKLALWQALAAIGDDEPALGPMDLQGLIRRAETQRVALERERLALAPEALSDEEG